MAPQSRHDSSNDAIDKHETAARSQPGKEDNENENEHNQNTDACHENRMRNLADCLIQLLHIFAAVKAVVENRQRHPGLPATRRNQ